VKAKGNFFFVAAIEVWKFEVGSDVADFQFRRRLRLAALSFDLRADNRRRQQPDP
jgi:hypothetical protein